VRLRGCHLDRLSLYAARVFEIEISGTTITARTAVNGDPLVGPTPV
jgi:hypothetical protein